MSSKGAKTLVGVLLAAFCGAVIGLFVLIGLIFFVPTGASNTNIENIANRTTNVAPENKRAEENISSPTPAEIEPAQTPEEEFETPSPTPKTTFTPITLPTPAPKPNKTPAVNQQNSGAGKSPKTPSKPSPKKPVPTPSVHT